MELKAALLKILKRLRVMAHLMVIEADGALILLAAPNRFLFLRTLAVGNEILHHDQRQREKYEHHSERHQESKSGFFGTSGACNSIPQTASAEWCCVGMGPEIHWLGGGWGPRPASPSG